MVPLDGALTAALRSLRVRQSEELLVAGEAWSDEGHVFTDALGTPCHSRRAAGI